jgi:hypothetical protein
MDRFVAAVSGREPAAAVLLDELVWWGAALRSAARSHRMSREEGELHE